MGREGPLGWVPKAAKPAVNPTCSCFIGRGSLGQQEERTRGSEGMGESPCKVVFYQAGTSFARKYS